MKNKKQFIKIVIIGIILILIQTMFQNTKGLLSIIHNFLGNIRPFIYAIFISILFEPLVSFIERKIKKSRGISLIISILIVTLILAGILFWFIPNLIESFEDIIKKFPTFQQGFNKYLEDIFNFLRRKNLILLDEGQIKAEIEKFFVKNINNIRDILISLGLNVMGQIMEIFIILFGAFLGLYLVYDKEYFMDWIKNLMLVFWGPTESEEGFNFLIESKNIFLNYIMGKMAISLVIAIISFIVMKLTAIPYALIISFVIGIGNMIPFFGPLISALLSLTLVLLTVPIKCIPLSILILITQAIDGYILGPKILGKSVGLNGFWIIASVIIMGNLMGTVGMFLGVPIFAIIRVIYIKILKNKKEQLKLENKKI